jgi:hypothetical protein
MTSICLAKSLTADTQARLLTYRKDYLIGNIECALLMYKVIMRLATIDFVATTQVLRDNLHALGAFASTVSGNIDKINAEFDKNYSQIIAQGATVNDPIGMLFAAYQVVPCFNFRTYINRVHKDYLNGKHPTITNESLMGMAKSKFNYLHNKGTWGAKYLDNNKIVAMTADQRAQRATQALAPACLLQREKRTKRRRRVRKPRTKRTCLIESSRKKGKVWKKIPPKEGEKHKKEHDGHTYHWCIHHMAWRMHTPKDCHLGKEHKGEKVANMATVAAAAATAVIPSYQALLSTLA